MSNYESLDEKLKKRQGKSTQTNLASKSYEYPSNINLPSASWAMAKGKEPINYHLYKLPEPLDEYDIARLNINLKRFDLPSNSNADYFYSAKYQHVEGTFVKLYGYQATNGKVIRPEMKQVRLTNQRRYDYTLNWYNYHRANEIPAAVKACGGVSGTDAVRFENFMTNIMQPYYQKPDWAYRLVFNSGIENKGRISSMEQGSKKLNNNIQGTFPGANGYYDYTFGIVNLDNYILGIQVKMAKTLALLNYNGKCSQLSNYKHSLTYFLPPGIELPAGKSYEKNPMNYFEDRYDGYAGRRKYGGYGGYEVEYSSLYKWKSVLQEVSKNERTNTIVFFGSGTSNNNNNNNTQNGVLKVRGNYGKFTLDYNDNSMSFDYLTVRSKDRKKVYYHWDGVKNESYEYIYDKNGYLIETKNYFDLPATRNGRVLEGTYANDDYIVSYGSSKGGRHNIVNSNNSNSILLDKRNDGSGWSNELDNADILTFDYDFSKNQVLINALNRNKSTTSAELVIYDVTNDEHRRVVRIKFWWVL